AKSRGPGVMARISPRWSTLCSARMRFSVGACCNCGPDYHENGLQEGHHGCPACGMKTPVPEFSFSMRNLIYDQILPRFWTNTKGQESLLLPHLTVLTALSAKISPKQSWRELYEAS